MRKDEAMEIAQNAHDYEYIDLFAAYDKFHRIVENTPNWLCGHGVGNTDDPAFDGRPANWQQGLHAAIGMATEAAEILDAYKKELYGKNKPISPMNMREEAGDMFFYLWLHCRAHGLDLREIIADNVVKLANRYIDKLEV